jgi:glycine betaine/proline transport system substrate-binding protein
LVALACLLGLVACTSSGSGDDAADSPTSVDRFEPKPTINLVVNDWTASALNVAVAEGLIERYLGYPVIPTRIDDTTQLYEGLAEGSLDAVLEIWPSTMSDRHRRYFDRGEVVDLGALGVVGKVGWFVPAYVVRQNPGLASWEGYASPEVASQFATPGTEPLGRFLGTNPTYEQYDEQIIANLGLPFEVEFSGSEEATMAELDTRHRAGEPLLLYWWTPTAAVGTYDLVNVALPMPTEECAASALAEDGRVNCDYPEDVLLKAASPQLAAKAPDVARFLDRFTISSEDQIGLLVAVEHEGATIEAAAAAWIEANEEIWRTWLDPEEPMDAEADTEPDDS